MRLHKLFEKEKLELPDLEVGDEVKVGKFKNRKAEITGFDTDEHNQPVMKTTKGDQKVFKNRHSKLEESAGTIYYHGTNREFGKFEIGADKANRATNITGIYFTPHQWEAEDYGKRVIQARLRYNKLFNVQQWNDINGAMKRKALELLAKHTTYREEWLKSAIIPDLVEKGYFAGGLRDVSGDIKREILLAGGYDAIKDGDHIAMLTTDGIEVINNVEEDYQWDDAEEGYDFENPLPIIDDADIWDEIEELEADIKDDWEERTGKDWRETYGKVAGGYKRFWKEVSVVETVPINKIICTEKWLSKDHIDRIQSGESRKDSLPLIHVVMGKYIATDGNHRIVAAALNGEKSIRCDVIHLPGTNESIDEASYDGNIGIMELIKFKQTAPPAIKKLLDYLIAAGRGKEAWKVVQQQTRTNLKGKQFK